jgi:hypothetical protein
MQKDISGHTPPQDFEDGDPTSQDFTKGILTTPQNIESIEDEELKRLIRALGNHRLLDDAESYILLHETQGYRDARNLIRQSNSRIRKHYKYRRIQLPFIRVPDPSQDSISSWVRSIQQYKEVHELDLNDVEIAVLFDPKHIQAFNFITRHNMRLVIHLANAYKQKTPLGFSDLFTAGVIGLIDGITTYDLARNTALSTNLYHHIRGGILVSIRKEFKYRKPLHEEPLNLERIPAGNSTRNLEEKVLNRISPYANFAGILSEVELVVISLKYQDNSGDGNRKSKSNTTVAKEFNERYSKKFNLEGEIDRNNIGRIVNEAKAKIAKAYRIEM